MSDLESFVNALISLPVGELVEIHNKLSAFYITEDGVEVLYKPENAIHGIRWYTESDALSETNYGSIREMNLAALNGYKAGLLAEDSTVLNDVSENGYYYITVVNGVKCIANRTEYGDSVLDYLKAVIPARFCEDDIYRDQMKEMFSRLYRKYGLYAELAKHPFVSD